MGRLPRHGKEYYQEQEEGTMMKKGAWSAEEDQKLVAFITKNKGHGSWRTLPRLAGLERCGKSCRLRWTNYLRPNIKRGNFSSDEELVILRLHALLGNKWSAIASHLPGRTDNEVKNHWNTYLKKRLTRMGLDPATHLPFNILPAARSLHGDPSASIRSNVDWQKAFMLHALKVNSGMACHLLQWELVRLEAEARQQQLASSHGKNIQNCATAWLQSLRQMPAPACEVDSPFMAANVQIHPVNEHHAFSPTQVQSFQISNNDSLLNASFPPCQSNGMSSSVSALQIFQGSPLSNEESEQLPEDCILNSATGGSTGSHDTCNSSDLLSSHLLPSQFDVPDDLISLDPFSDKRYNPMHILDPHESSLLSLGDRTTGQQDSYWNRMLKFLDQVTMENL